MSFDAQEIRSEFDTAAGMGREFFSGDAYSFRRLSKVEGIEPLLVKRLMNARWRKANPEAVRAYWRKWRAQNPERARAYVAAYLAREPERKRAMRQARKRRWQQKNRAKYNAAQRAAYARRKAKSR